MYMNTKGSLSLGDTPKDTEWGKMEEGEIPPAGKAGKRTYRKAKSVRFIEVAVKKKEKRKFTLVQPKRRRTELVTKRLILRLKKQCKQSDGKGKESDNVVKELSAVMEEKTGWHMQEEQMKELLQSESESD